MVDTGRFGKQESSRVSFFGRYYWIWQCVSISYRKVNIGRFCKQDSSRVNLIEIQFEI